MGWDNSNEVDGGVVVGPEGARNSVQCIRRRSTRLCIKNIASAPKQSCAMRSTSHACQTLRCLTAGAPACEGCAMRTRLGCDSSGLARSDLRPQTRASRAACARAPAALHGPYGQPARASRATLPPSASVCACATVVPLVCLCRTRATKVPTGAASLSRAILPPFAPIPPPPTPIMRAPSSNSSHHTSTSLK